MTRRLGLLILLTQAGCCGMMDSGSQEAAPVATPTATTEATPADPQPITEPVPIVPTSVEDWEPGPDPKLARNFYVVFDGSGSMAYRQCAGEFERKLPAAQWAFSEFLPAVEAEANLGLVIFDKGGMREVVPIGPGTRKAVEEQVSAIRAGRGTPLGPAIDVAVAALGKQKEKQLGYGEYHLVVVTDGMADNANALTRAVDRAVSEGVLLHTIGFCVSANSELKKASYTFRTAQNPEELRSAVLGVLAEAEDFQSLEFEQIQ